MCVIHGKHIVIHDINVFSQNIFTNYAISLYSASDGQLEWCHQFAPLSSNVMVNHLSDHFIMIVSEDDEDDVNGQRLTLAQQMMNELTENEEKSLALARAIVEAWAASETGFSINLIVDTTKQYLEERLNLVAPEGVHVGDMNLSFDSFEVGTCIVRSLGKLLKAEHQRGNYLDLRVEDPFRKRRLVWDPYEVGEANFRIVYGAIQRGTVSGSSSSNDPQRAGRASVSTEMDSSVASILANCAQCRAQDEVMEISLHDQNDDGEDDDESDHEEERSEDENLVPRNVRIYNFLLGDQRLWS
uniref:UDP-N-acetylglucosamine 1-carboxyvinyltransferase n=1 Tax=Lygus hesperus TaxID=30085 RepID=A0A0A9WXJ5_LYGHE